MRGRSERVRLFSILQWPCLLVPEVKPALPACLYTFDAGVCLLDVKSKGTDMHCSEDTLLKVWVQKHNFAK